MKLVRMMYISVLLVVMWTIYSFAAVIEVRPSGTLSTLKSAISAANENDTLRLSAGTYVEHGV